MPSTAVSLQTQTIHTGNIILKVFPKERKNPMGEGVPPESSALRVGI